jgi:membrane-associated protease RseP (regulator of RpoE activity)
MADSDSSFASPTIEYYSRPPEPEGRPPRERYWLHALLLLGTIFTTLVVGARMEFNFLHNIAPLSVGDEVLPFFALKWALRQPSRLLLGIPFSATLLLILMAHEMGHYLFCRFYGVRATLPFFIPAPTMIGTMGAVIRIKAPIRSRAALFDIGIAGPIAGFVFAVVTLLLALPISKPLAPNLGPSDLRLGFPAIFYAAHAVLKSVDPSYAVAGLPMSRIYLHPTAIAAWVGMFATALNLLPSSQLDGGHIVYALAPRAHRTVSWFTVAFLAYLGRLNYVWWFWGVLLIVMNVLTRRQRQAPEFPVMPGNRWVLGLIALIMLALTFTISPVQVNLH